MASVRCWHPPERTRDNTCRWQAVTLEMVDAKKCGLCYEWFEAEQMRWDAEPYCYVCKDDEACTARRPGARGRKRARREGSYASMSRGA